MKKISIVLTFIAIVCFLFPMTVMAKCIGCATIKITARPVEGEAYRIVTINYSFPAGFPSWAEETTKAVYSDPLLVLADKIANIEVERIRETATGGYLRKIPANFYTNSGCLIIRKTFRAYPGEFLSLLVTTWAGLKYELAIDDPIKRPGINQVYCLRGVFFAKLHDGTWGIKVR